MKRYSIVEWLLLGIIISFCSPWFIWASSFLSGLQYFFTISVFALFIKQGRFKTSHGLLIFGLLLFYFVIFQINNTIHFSYVPIAISYLVATRINEKEANNVVNLATDYLFVSIIVSLPLWLFHQFVTPLPVIDMIDVSSMKSGDTEIILYENHFFFITVEGYEAMRFYSWFDEPGVLGTFAAFILWANKYDLKKKRNLVILIGALFTFSLAFYILTIVGWLIRSAKSVKTVLISLVIALTIGYGFYYYLQDNLAFQQEIINRVVDPEGKGVDARMGLEVGALWDSYGKTSKMLFGLGSGALEKYGGISKSYLCFILELGYVGLFLLVIAYLSLVGRKIKESYFTLFLFLLSFLQRPQLYTAFGFILFACITLKFANEKKVIYKYIQI